MEKELAVLLTPNQKTVITLQNIAKIGNVIVIIIGVICLIGWHLKIDITTNVFQNVIGMQPMAAIGFIFSATALFLQLIDDINKKSVLKSGVAFLLGSLTLVLGIFTTVIFFLQHSIQINPQLSLSLNISLSFILIGIALLLLPIPTGKHFMRIAQGLILLAALLSMFAILGFLYESVTLSNFLPIQQMPLSSAITLGILCLSLLLARPNRGFTKVLTRNTPSSIFALRLIIIALTLPAILGFIILQAQEYHLLNPQIGLTLLVMGTICLFSIAVWLNSSASQKLELENIIIRSELEKKNISLETDAKTLATKMIELEEEKQEVFEKLTNQEKLLEFVGNTS